MNTRDNEYANKLSELIKCETVSSFDNVNIEKFRRFHDVLRTEFPSIFSKCEFLDFDGSFLMKWAGKNKDKPPRLFMNHHDVVAADGEWKYPPFSGKIAEEKVWGRGTLDTKLGLFGMLQAADELAFDGFVPDCDIYFLSACNEETTGDGANNISKYLEEKGIEFDFTLDEGGYVMYDPIGGADGEFAVIGVGEKGCADLKFIARSKGGHASTPPKNSPLVRLGKFMAATERSNIFTVKMAEPTKLMLKRMSLTMTGVMRGVCASVYTATRPVEQLFNRLSPTTKAMVRSTVAFTMASGSAATNVLPPEAWVIGNLRFSHHQGGEDSIKKLTELAAKYDVEVEILDPGFASPISSTDSNAYKNIEKAVNAIMPGVIPAPYIMTGASDSRYLSRVCKNCFRFAPFMIGDEQLASIHGDNENVDIKTLSKGVDFYKYLMKEV